MTHKSTTKFQRKAITFAIAGLCSLIGGNSYSQSAASAQFGTGVPGTKANSNASNSNAGASLEKPIEKNITIVAAGIGIDNTFSTSSITVGGKRYIESSALLKQYSISAAITGNKLEFVRGADRAKFVLDLDSGELTFSNQLVGRLEQLGYKEAQTEWNLNKIYLAPNTVQVLTGTQIDEKNADVLKFNLDPRLVAYDNFRISVDGSILAGVTSTVRGSIVLVPIEAIAKSLGQNFTWDKTTGIIKNYRMHDGARVEVQVSTGLVKINDRVVGVSPGSFNYDTARGLVTAQLVQTVTASEMTIDSQRSIIEFSLNERLKNTALPQGEILDDIKARPFKLLKLDYQLNLPGGASAQADVQFKEYSAVIRSDLDNVMPAQGSDNQAPLRLRNSSVIWNSAQGSSGSFGTISATKRELQGVNEGIMRGATYFKPMEDYALGFAGGQIPKQKPDGTERYEGYLVGARFYPKKKPGDEFSWEVGASAMDDPEFNKKMQVVSLNTQVTPKNREDLSWSAQIDAGNYSSPTYSGGTARTILYGSKEIGKNYLLSADARYLGRGYKEVENINGINVTRDELNANANLTMPPFEAFGFKLYPGARYSKTILGLVDGKDTKRDVDTFTGSLATQFSGISLSGSLGKQFYTESWLNQKTNDTVIDVSASKTFEKGTLDLRYNSAVAVKQQVGSVSWNFLPITKNTSWGETSLNLGVSSYFGKVDDKKFNSARTNLLVSQNFPIKNGFTTSAGIGVASGWDSVNKRLQTNNYSYVRAEKAIQSNMFGNGKIFVSLQRDSIGKLGIFMGLNMSNVFARSTGAGVLMPDRGMVRGQVYLKPEFSQYFKDEVVKTQAIKDENEKMAKALEKSKVEAPLDPVSENQEAMVKEGAMLEPSVYKPVFDNVTPSEAATTSLEDKAKPEKQLGVGVQTEIKIKGTSAKLTTDKNGFYTIQNMPAGVYTIEVDTGVLPLNYKVDDSFKGLASVAPGKITELNVPIVLSGTVKGRLKNVEEGTEVSIYKADKNGVMTLLIKTTTGFGGQFVFDSLIPGSYEVRYEDEKGLKSSCKADIKIGELERDCKILDDAK